MSSINMRCVQKGLCVGLRILRQKPLLNLTSSSRAATQWNTPHVTTGHQIAPGNPNVPLTPTPEVSDSFKKAADVTLLNVGIADNSLTMTFSDGSHGEAPYLWLRDNCQCSSCFDSVALGRKFLLINLDLKTKAEKVECHKNNVKLAWNDGHISTFNSSWLYDRAFNDQSRQGYRSHHRHNREPWGSGLILDKFNYSDLKSNNKVLLNWLLTLEKKGVALVVNSPDDPDAGASLIDHVGFVKNSHYGRRSPVYIRENSNNVAFTNLPLGLHTDLSQYEHQAGIILIQTVEQHKGQGGESVISDGLHCTELLRKNNPSAFQILSKTNVYFWDKGTANLDMEMDEFYKISKYPVIGLDTENNLSILRMNNQVRDSHLDLPPSTVNEFYEALKTLNDYLYANSFSFKMKNGEILCLDNERCLHGRQGFASASSRHLESAYLDWDEARCKRRRLQEKLGSATS